MTNPTKIPQTTSRGYYIRFGGVPPGLRSFDHQTKQFETGISILAPTTFIDQDRLAVDFDRIAVGSDDVFTRECAIKILLDRPTYLLSGKEIGRGGDGEPLLSDVVVWAGSLDIIHVAGATVVFRFNRPQFRPPPPTRFVFRR